MFQTKDAEGNQANSEPAISSKCASPTRILQKCKLQGYVTQNSATSLSSSASTPFYALAVAPTNSLNYSFISEKKKLFQRQGNSCWIFLWESLTSTYVPSLSYTRSEISSAAINFLDTASPFTVTSVFSTISYTNCCTIKRTNSFCLKSIHTRYKINQLGPDQDTYVNSQNCHKNLQIFNPPSLQWQMVPTMTSDRQPLTYSSDLGSVIKHMHTYT